MDDPRIEWIKDKVNFALDVTDPQIFEDLLNKDGGATERTIAKFLNESPEDGQSAILFYKEIVEEDIEVEVECGMYLKSLLPY